jgi:small nuclear ribonucleoprotein G
MSKAHPPELKKFMDKKLGLQINGGRQIQGILRGYDPFMNLVIDEGVEKKKTGEMQQVTPENQNDRKHELKLWSHVHPKKPSLSRKEGCM